PPVRSCRTTAHRLRHDARKARTGRRSAPCTARAARPRSHGGPRERARRGRRQLAVRTARASHGLYPHAEDRRRRRPGRQAADDDHVAGGRAVSEVLLEPMEEPKGSAGVVERRVRDLLEQYVRLAGAGLEEVGPGLLRLTLPATEAHAFGGRT